MIDYRRLRTDLVALGLLAGAVFLGLSLYSYSPADPPGTSVWPIRSVSENLCGPIGAQVAHYSNLTLGMGAWFLLAIIVLFDLRLFHRRFLPDPIIRMIGCVLMLVAVCVGWQMLAARFGRGPVIGSGGYIGAWGKTALAKHLSTGGTLIVTATIFLTGVLLTTELIMYRLGLGIVLFPVRAILWPLVGDLNWLSKSRLATPVALPEQALAQPAPAALAPVPTLTTESGEKSKRGKKGKSQVESVPGTTVGVAAANSAGTVAASPDDEFVPSGSFKVNPPMKAASVTEDSLGTDTSPNAVANTTYELPPIEMLEVAEEFPFELLAQKAAETRAVLEKTFQQFQLNVKVTEADTGPVVTQFELELEPGLRASKVTGLADDLALALRVPAVRVVTAIPGKNTMGVEVPNERRVTVRMRELIEAVGVANEKHRIPIFLGKDVSGHPLVVDLTKMPHLLIAGRTGTGKSVCLNTLILSMLLTRSPEDVKMLMIDPKMVELSPYTRLPHLMHPVITDMKKAEAVLAWAVDKMEERYDLLSRVGVRHMDMYNKLGREAVLKRLNISPNDEDAAKIPERMPYIVIIADEMADMMMTSGKDVEGHIIRLAQKARAVGIHLVLATQKPTVDVITGLIKSNLPARISFQVASRTDSRVVLDENGAERLLGNGDLLYLAPGTSSLNRAQGTYVSDDEINKVIDFFGKYEPQYSDELAAVTAKAITKEADDEDDDGEPKERDDLYDKAVRIVIREERGSCSLLQRALKIGYGRAARMIEHMGDDGVVGPYNGSKFRDVIISEEEWEEMREEVFAGVGG